MQVQIAAVEPDSVRVAREYQIDGQGGDPSYRNVQRNISSAKNANPSMISGRCLRTDGLASDAIHFVRFLETFSKRGTQPIILS